MTSSAKPLDHELESFAPEVRDDVVARRYGDEIVAWSPVGARPVYLPPVATVAFQLFDGSATLAELGEDVSDVVGIPYPVALDQLRRVAAIDGAQLLSTSLPSSVVGELEDDVFPAPPNP